MYADALQYVYKDGYIFRHKKSQTGSTIFYCSQKRAFFSLFNHFMMHFILSYYTIRSESETTI